MTKSSFVTEKNMCKVHMRVFEIVAHRIMLIAGHNNLQYVHVSGCRQFNK